MLTFIGDRVAAVFRRWLPDPFVFAIILTIATGVTAMWWVRATPLEVVIAWYDGFWMLLEFGMQMVLILVTGYAIALSAPVGRLIDGLGARLRRPTAVYLGVLVAGGLFVLVSWGWLVLAAVLGRELASRVKGLNYPFLVACVHISGQAWVVGLSSSIPLVLNTPDNFLIEAGLLSTTIPISETLGSPLNFAVMAVFLVGSPLLMWTLRPRGEAVALDELRAEHDSAASSTVAEEVESLRAPHPVPSDRFNASVALQLVVVLMGLAYVVRHFATRGFDINLNIMIFIFLMTGLALHRTPIRYVVAMKRSCSNVSGIIFQYPFYAGIMGIMMATGLGTAMARWMATQVGPQTLPLAAFGLGGLVNLAIPSAGGEWAVLGPPLVEAVRELSGSVGIAELHSRIARVAMAVAYGESLTNLVQPFFLLVILPVMGAGLKLQARDLMGYVFLPFLALFVTVGLLVTLLPG
jgi:short-chain fatty acids transporter